MEKANLPFGGSPTAGPSTKEKVPIGLVPAEGVDATMQGTLSADRAGTLMRIEAERGSSASIDRGGE
jgi:hypothetical protein